MTSIYHDGPHQIELQRQLADLPLKIRWYQSLDSTNHQAQIKLNHNWHLPFVLISNQQTAGYGKQQRPFISQEGGIYLSLAAKVPQLNSQNGGLLTTGVVAVVQQTIQEYWHINTEIKWVNDLLVQQHKIAGILIENPQPQQVIIGIGINLYQKNLTQQIATAANLLAQPPTTEAKLNFIATLVRALINFLPEFQQKKYLIHYRQHLSLLNQNVQIKIGQKFIYGKAWDIDAQGSLILLTDNGFRTITAGDVIKVNNLSN